MSLDYKNMTEEELRKQVKSMKTVVIVFTVLIVFSTVLSVYQLIRDDSFSPLTVSIFAILTFMFIYLRKLKEIKNELKNR